MSQTQLFALTYKAIFSMNYEIKSMRIPDDDSYSYGTSSDGQSILEVDFEACKALLRKEICSASAGLFMCKNIGAPSPTWFVRF